MIKMVVGRPAKYDWDKIRTAYEAGMPVGEILRQNEGLSKNLLYATASRCKWNRKSKQKKQKKQKIERAKKVIKKEKPENEKELKKSANNLVKTIKDSLPIKKPIVINEGGHNVSQTRADIVVGHRDDIYTIKQGLKKFADIVSDECDYIARIQSKNDKFRKRVTEGIRNLNTLTNILQSLIDMERKAYFISDDDSYLGEIINNMQHLTVEQKVQYVRELIERSSAKNETKTLEEWSNG